MNFDSGNYYTVTELNDYVSRILERNNDLVTINIKGEIDDFKRSDQGHWYFTLKDSYSSLRCVMFSGYASATARSYYPKNGDKVTIIADVKLSKYKFMLSAIAKRIEPEGLGKQYEALLELKRKLQQEGLFDASKKKPINIFPNKIGIISSIGSSGCKDILVNLKRRYPIADLLIFPAAMQGINAPKQIIAAIKKAQTYDLDTIIIGRGGGDAEDLSAFNDEMLVREVFACKIPIITAIGHETDFTLVDYASDVRVSTPTGAAEKATVDRREIEDFIYRCESELKLSLKRKVSYLRDKVEFKSEELKTILLNKLNTGKLKVDRLNAELDNLNPMNVLSRGYSVTTDSNGNVVKSIKDLNVNDSIITVFENGSIQSIIKEKREK